MRAPTISLSISGITGGSPQAPGNRSCLQMFLHERELEAKRQHALKKTDYKYDGTCRKLSDEEIKKGENQRHAVCRALQNPADRRQRHLS